MPGSRPALGELERAVMERLWSAPEGVAMTVREVHDALAGERQIAYTTVMTVMDRLARKEMVIQERAERAYGYRPRAGRAEMTAELMRQALGDFAEHDRGSALVAFIEEASPEDVAVLRRALRDLD